MLVDVFKSLSQRKGIVHQRAQVLAIIVADLETRKRNIVLKPLVGVFFSIPSIKIYRLDTL